MYKKLIFFIVFVGFGIGASYSDLNAEEYCAFCDESVWNRQKFYEDDLVYALYTYKPILPGHYLIIPKRHVDPFEMLTDQEISQIGRVMKKVNEAASKVFDTSAYMDSSKKWWWSRSKRSSCTFSLHTTKESWCNEKSNRFDFT